MITSFAVLDLEQIAGARFFLYKTKVVTIIKLKRFVAGYKRRCKSIIISIDFTYLRMKSSRKEKAELEVSLKHIK